jgi:hypothetical protein
MQSNEEVTAVLVTYSRFLKMGHLIGHLKNQKKCKFQGFVK